MSRNWKEYIPAIFNGVTGIGVIVISIFADTRFSWSTSIAKPLGMIIILAGMSVVVWATMHIRNAIMGEVEPVLEVLVQDGPYRFVRHPVYSGMTMAMIGVAVSTRNWLGLIAVLILFLPSEIYRAKLEDKALHIRFGNIWESYASRTGFMLPLKFLSFTIILFIMIIFAFTALQTSRGQAFTNL